MTSFLVPIDFTESASNAARYAADMAAAMGADLQLIHIWRTPDLTPKGPLSADVLEEIRNSCLSSLETLATELHHRTAGKVHVGIHFGSGDFENNIKGLCQGKKPLFIIAGTTVAPSLRYLPYPLLLLPDHATYHAIRNIVLACDADEIRAGIPVSIDFFRKLRDKLGAHFSIIHVCTGKQAKGKTHPVPASSWGDSLAVGVPELHFIEAPTVEDGIHQYFTNHPADWLMVFPRKNGLFHMHKSLSKNIVLHCPLPALTVPA